MRLGRPDAGAAGATAPGLRHRQQEIGHGLAGQGAAVRQHDSQGRAFDGELRLALQRRGVRAGQQQQAEVEGVAEEQPAIAGRDHRGHTQVHQHRCGLLARGADAEVAPGHDHVARAHLAGKRGHEVFQAVRRDAFDAQLHVRAGRQRVGVDVVAKLPDGVPQQRRVHASTSRGSVMRPRSAEAATV
jgi:hypothetical protein